MKDLFCFFSGYTKNCLTVLKTCQREKLGVIEITLRRLNKDLFSVDEYIQLNGVLCQIIAVSNSELTVSTTSELASNTSLENIAPEQKVSLGRLANQDRDHTDLYTLQPSANGQAEFLGGSVAPGHEHTLKLDFKCPSTLSFVQEGKYLGLSGSSLTAMNVAIIGKMIKFSIFCGKETREQTHFNRDLAVGTRVNITEPHQEVQNTTLTKLS